MSVILETTLGDITIDLFIDHVPVLAANFLKLCKLKHYNNDLFHSVEKNFIARTGLTDTIGGKPSDRGSILSVLKVKNLKAYKTLLHNPEQHPLFSTSTFDPETGLFHEQFHTKLKHDTRGTVSMANDVPNCIGSSFFITLRDSIDYLDKQRSVIGVVVEGLDVLDALNSILVEDQVSYCPLRPIRILHTIVLDDPFPDPPGLFLEQRIPSPLPILDTVTDVAESTQQLSDTDVIEKELVAFERIASSEAKSRAVALEILGDLPDADLAPPENVLFVCKLNPITEAQDLELIFSRFGKILSCEIIRDWKTGDSLQYAFIEFESAKSCEAALFKMEGCLIDDRRIHVDFCQSVSKQWAAFRRFGSHQKQHINAAPEPRLGDSRHTRPPLDDFVFSHCSERHTQPSGSSRRHDPKRYTSKYSSGYKRVGGTHNPDASTRRSKHRHDKSPYRNDKLYK